MFSELLEIILRITCIGLINVSSLISKIREIILRFTCIGILKTLVWISKLLVIRFWNTTYLFWNYRKFILEPYRNSLRTTDNSIPNFCFLFIINPLFTHQKGIYRLVIHLCFIIGIMINKNMKEGVLKLKWMWVEVYKDIFRNGKRCFRK